MSIDRCRITREELVDLALAELAKLEENTSEGVMGKDAVATLREYLIGDTYPEVRIAARETVGRIAEKAREMAAGGDPTLEERARGNSSALESLAANIKQALTSEYAKFKHINTTPAYDMGFPTGFTLVEVVDGNGCIACIRALGALGFESSVRVIGAFSEVEDKITRLSSPTSLPASKARTQSGPSRAWLATTQTNWFGSRRRPGLGKSAA